MACNHTKLNEITNFNFCPYCGIRFIAKKRQKRYRYEGQMGILAKKGSYAINTGIKRVPKQGEYYMSGVLQMAYIARYNLSTEYYIAKVINPN